jgi:hypothetical protein
MKTLTTLPAHYDGKEIKLDVPFSIEPNTRLLITILDQSEDSQQFLVEAAMIASEAAFARVWDNEEDDIYNDL